MVKGGGGGGGGWHCVFVALIYYTLMKFFPLADYGGISHLLREMAMPIIETHSVTVSWKTAIRVFSVTSDY